MKDFKDSFTFNLLAECIVRSEDARLKTFLSERLVDLPIEDSEKVGFLTTMVQEIRAGDKLLGLNLLKAAKQLPDFNQYEDLISRFLKMPGPLAETVISYLNLIPKERQMQAAKTALDLHNLTLTSFVIQQVGYLDLDQNEIAHFILDQINAFAADGKVRKVETIGRALGELIYKFDALNERDMGAILACLAENGIYDFLKKQENASLVAAHSDNAEVWFEKATKGDYYHSIIKNLNSFGLDHNRVMEWLLESKTEKQVAELLRGGEIQKFSALESENTRKLVEVAPEVLIVLSDEQRRAVFSSEALGEIPDDSELLSSVLAKAMPDEINGQEHRAGYALSKVPDLLQVTDPSGAIRYQSSFVGTKFLDRFIGIVSSKSWIEANPRYLDERAQLLLDQLLELPESEKEANRKLIKESLLLIKNHCPNKSEWTEAKQIRVNALYAAFVEED